jgi:hypothetical protein
MASTYQDFLETVAQEDREFVNKLDTIFKKNDCKTEIKEAKNGYVATYFYMRDKKKISLMNFVFRKNGMRTRIYARHIHYYQNFLDTLPEEMKKDIMNAGICKKISGISECSPTCTGGYEFTMDKEIYKKCKNMAFFLKVCGENNSLIEQFIEHELKYIDII